MKAMLLSEYKKLDIVDMPMPEVGPNDLLVQVKACGICGSDIHGWDGSSGRRIPPLVMGHEAAGVVAEVGANVKNFAMGDRVTFDSTVSCGPRAAAGRSTSAKIGRCWGSHAMNFAGTERLPSTCWYRRTSPTNCLRICPSNTRP